MGSGKEAQLAKLRGRLAELEAEVKALRRRPLQPGLDTDTAAALLADLRNTSHDRRRILANLLQALGTDVDQLS